ncbi:alpha/beta fold hydrolase [Parerythrobacter aestuarii]|uniref:alpha/beta fold hydrolase n=1 Tax=Parerythrobacter aestuarii TaxID=3020909 RepID=UPI0024DEE53C|nr:alpha/beta hydrolase [Parerythrobacter aestuarii]
MTDTAVLDRLTDDRPFADRFWNSEDGLALHYRDYDGSPDRLPVVCMHGLTRNARDFAGLAAILAPSRRVIVPEMRGRGDSAYAKDSSTYEGGHYVADVARLLGELGIDRFIAIGTSMGGIMTMLLANAYPGRIAAAVINDIGPRIEAVGLAHIGSYVGQGRSFETWMHAARALREVQCAAHPKFGIEDWLAMAKRVMVLGQGGRIAFDYDMSIADTFSEGEAPDLWPFFEALADVPMVLVRGARSNILSQTTAEQMQSRSKALEIVTVAETGHAPLLTEPEALAAIDRLLEAAP